MSQTSSLRFCAFTRKQPEETKGRARLQREQRRTTRGSSRAVMLQRRTGTEWPAMTALRGGALRRKRGVSLARAEGGWTAGQTPVPPTRSASHAREKATEGWLERGHAVPAGRLADHSQVATRYPE